jgi:hypothetical protein
MDRNLSNVGFVCDKVTAESAGDVPKKLHVIAFDKQRHPRAQGPCQPEVELGSE